MATWFEIRVADGDASYAQQAADEAFRQLDHLEALLSRFRENSEVSAISQLRSGEAVMVSPETFQCLSLALEVSQLTGGAFDPALGAAMDRLRDPEAEVQTSPEERGVLVLDRDRRSVGCEGPSVALDLGAIGKGYAIDQLALTLLDWELGSCLLIGGGSSILATGPASEGWEVGITSTARLRLMQGAVGCSGLAVKGSHILDPRTGTPAPTPARTWNLAIDAALADALSTACMIMPQEDIVLLCEKRPDIGVIIQPRDDSPDVQRLGRALAVHHGFERLKST